LNNDNNSIEAPVKASGEYFLELDSIRFLAFLLIFIHHTNDVSIPLVSDIQRIGWIGVDIFLCLSAFLLTRLLNLELKIHGKLSIGKFYVRRILRIWPLYFVYITFILAATNIFGTAEINYTRFATLATFTDNIATALYGFNPILATGHLWTISYEEQFYLLLPFFVLLAVRLETYWSRRLVLVIVISIGLMTRKLLMTSNVSFQPAAWVLPITHFESVIAGILLAMNYRKLFGKKSLFVILSITSFIVLWLFPDPEIDDLHVLISYPIVAIFSFSLIALVVTQTPGQSLLLRVIRYLGKISYGLYVFHVLCLTLAYHFNPFRNIFFDSLIALIACILFAALSFEIFEKKFLKLKQRYGTLTGRTLI
jgi:peptidoglycan/LPS O-acetylase OafA/YrhL